MDQSIVQELMRRENVVSVGEGLKNGTGPISIVVGVVVKLPLEELSPQDVVPQEIGGVLTDVVEVGIIRAFENTGLHRPALGGDSIGHFAITAGTLGAVVRNEGQRVILSNNHVMANSNEANIGDAILQPGPYDGGVAPAIATLQNFVPITFIGDIPSDCSIGNRIANVANALSQSFGRSTRLHAMRPLALTNLVDAAIARPIRDMDVADEIRGVGQILGSARGQLGQRLIKSGRTTDVTTGEVLQINVTVQVQYGAGKIAMFEDQMMAGAMSAPGDSGSAVLNADTKEIVGLLFAGSDQSTIINQIENVFQELDLTL